MLHQSLTLVRRRWTTLAALSLFALAVGAGTAALQTPAYSATARVYFATRSATSIPPSEASPADRSTTPTVFLITATDLDTYVDVMGSPLLAEAIRAELALPEWARFTLTAQVPGSSPVLDITATATEGDLAADVANAAGPQLAAVAQDFSLLLASGGQTVQSNPIAPAVTPSHPSSPDVPRFLGISLALGVAAGIAVARARESLDGKIRDEEGLAGLSAAPVLATVPLDHDHPLVMKTRPYSPGAEAVRRLRANLRFVDLARDRRAVVITSALPGEGKTTTAVNLAIAVAAAGARVLLLDADLRKPAVASVLDLDGRTGLTAVLLGDADLDSAVQRWGETTLFVLPAGQVPPNPSEVLGSTPMGRLFAQLERLFDVIVIDSPPVVPVIDAVLLHDLAGATLVVVGVDRATRNHVGSAIRSLERGGAAIVGFVLNKVAGRADGGYYEYEPRPPTVTSVTPGTTAQVRDTEVR